jgi:hypothetical protein
MTGAPMLKAAGLWEKTGAAGNAHLTGRLGGVRVLILENGDRTGNSEPTHRLFFVDGSKPAQTRNAAPASPRSASAQSTRRASDAVPGGVILGDPRDDLHSGTGR